MFVAATVHSAPPSPRTVRFLLSFLLSHLAEPQGGSRLSQLLSLLCIFSTLFPIHPPLTLAAHPPNFSVPHFPMSLLRIMHIFLTLPMLFPFFHLCFTTVQQPRILFFILQDLCLQTGPSVRVAEVCRENSHTSTHMYCDYELPERIKTQPHDDRDNCFLPFDSKGPLRYDSEQ